MPTPNKGPRMGGSPAHERLMLANLATALFEHGRITTTESKAKRLRPYAEHLITFGKRGDLHARRQVLKRLNAGAEYGFKDFLFLRTGYNFNYDTEGLGAGAGVKFPISALKTDAVFDYAYTDMKTLGASHRVSLNVRF